MSVYFFPVVERSSPYLFWAKMNHFQFTVPIAQPVAYRIREQEVTGSILDRVNILSEDSLCHRVHFSLTADHCFDSAYVGKQPVA